MQKHINKYFKNPKLRQLLEFPVLFLGALPEKIPALYSLMNYADIKGGTWYPEKGMYSIVDAMYKVATELGVKFQFNECVTTINIETNHVTEITSEVMGNEKKIINNHTADVVIATADYHFVETQLLPPQLRSYSSAYWDKRVLAPACLLYYIGLKKKLKNFINHTLYNGISS